MLTGARPFDGDSAAAVALARLTGPIPDPMAVRPSIPPELAAITRQALALEPSDRYASAGAMADALEAALAAAPSGQTTAGAAAAGAAGAAAAGAAATGATVVSATARPNPGGAAVRPGCLRRGLRAALDGRARAGQRPPADRAPVARPTASRGPIDEDEERQGTSPHGLARRHHRHRCCSPRSRSSSSSSRPAAGPPVTQVTVPNFVGQPIASATTQADGPRHHPRSDPGRGRASEPGTILTQDPAEGAEIDAGQRGQGDGRRRPGHGRGPGPQEQDRDRGTPGDLRRGSRSPASGPRNSIPLVPVGLVVSPEPLGGHRRGQGHRRSTASSRRARSRRRRPSPTPDPDADADAHRRRRPRHPSRRRRRRPYPPRSRRPSRRRSRPPVPSSAGPSRSADVAADVSRDRRRSAAARSRRRRGRAGRPAGPAGLRTRTPTSFTSKSASSSWLIASARASSRRNEVDSTICRTAS